MMEQKKALLLLISAPSGAGKSTLCNRLVERFPNMEYSISCTTRLPRGEEKNHVHYHFISIEEFERRKSNGEFLEFAKVHGNYYGTLKKTVEDVLAQGNDLIMDIDVQGAQKIREECEVLPAEDPVRQGLVDIFLAPPSMEELKTRLVGRGTDSEEIIAKRMKNAKNEMAHCERYRHLIVNENIDETFLRVLQIIEKERKTIL